MPEPYYASPSLLAQVTPGELSSDQAIPSFYYIDDNPNKFKLDYGYKLFSNGECFWDSVATSLEVGSYITCLGKAQAETSLKTSIATFRVTSIERDSDYRYKYRVRTSIGPNSLFSNQSFGVGNSTIQNVAGMNLQYKGIIQAEGVIGQNQVIDLGVDSGVDEQCWCWGSTLKLPQGPQYAAPIVISQIDSEPAPNHINVHFAVGNQPTVATLYYFYMEAYKPISPLY